MSRLRTLHIIVCCVVMLCIGPKESRAQQLDPANTRIMIQANFIYQFALNNNWPPSTRQGRFVIGVFGNPELFTQLKEKYGAKPIGSQVLEIVQVNDPGTAGFMHILVIDKSKKADLPRINKEIKDKNTLLVTNWEGALSSGAQINFKTVEGNLRYELSSAAMESHKITPGQKIIQWKVD